MPAWSSCCWPTAPAGAARRDTSLGLECLLDALGEPVVTSDEGPT